MHVISSIKKIVIIIIIIIIINKRWNKGDTEMKLINNVFPGNLNFHIKVM